jgi:hypothetical protein
MGIKMTKQIIEVNVDESSLALMASGVQVASVVMELSISNDDEYTNAAEFSKRVRSIQKDLNATRLSITAPLDEAKKTVMDLFRDSLSRLEKAQAVLDSGIRNYAVRKENERIEEQRRAAAVAAAEEARKRALLQEQIRKAEEAGREARVEALREKVELVHVPIVPKKVHQAPKVAGVSLPKSWKAAVQDYTKIPQEMYINDPKIQAQILSILNGIARSTRGGMKVDGVSFFEDVSVSMRS